MAVYKDTHEHSCDCHQEQQVLVPHVATIDEIRSETGSSDVKTFKVTFDDPTVAEDFRHLPGQCGMLSMLGIGEAMISITSSPTRKGFLEFSIKEMGKVTTALHQSPPGTKLGVRGPYGNGFPIEDLKGKNLVFIGGGIGLAPLRSLINYCLDNRDDYGDVKIIYGARSPQDLCFKEDLFENWPNIRDTEVSVTVDKGDDDWDGPVGFVPPYLEEVNPSTENAIAVTCGPPIMIKFVLQSLEKMGFTPENIITTLEMKMQCGVGKCGRCNIGDKYVCVDGPVFKVSDLQELPDEF